MMNFFRKHKVAIILIILVGFFGGTFIAGFGVSTFGKNSSVDTVAIVNGTKIPYKYYYGLYNNAINVIRQAGQENNEDIIKTTQDNIIRSLIQDELIWQQTKKYGIVVSDTELAQDIQSYPYFTNENGAFDIRLYYSFLNNLKFTPKEFETLRRKQIASSKLQMLIASSATVSPTEANNNKQQEAALLQVKANEVLNSWFDEVKKNSKIEITLEGRI